MTEAGLRGLLAERLEAAGDLPPEWRKAYDTDPDAWWEGVYSDASLITQADDGAGDPATGEGSWTSSLSAPGAVFASLAHLYVHDGQRVLDVGTGWTAALLSARLGDDHVTTVEVDPAVADQAAKNLVVCGRSPHLVVGDGALGHAAGAPYDRVHATCGVQRVPWAWVEQTRPGGVIVTPWSPGWAYGHLLRLTVGRDRAVGRLVGSAGYMLMRAQRHPVPDRLGDRPEHRTTPIDPRDVAWDDYGADVAIAALVPGVVSATTSEGDDTMEVRVWDGDGSWATTGYRQDRRGFAVASHGTRRLWDEVTDAYLTWVEWGRPARDRYGVTVTGEGQQIWLDTPDRVIGPSSPA
ncbi:protein-L-isoaspartate(D-aspartate) O-methyltransferase [Nonomuraea ceibae]|uniref:protein-L-isoaspartate(D-aspartate) O-methyltransferase n=1 Tax=Nonomuraea ceibae TaxID=1935170 RepID=UPI001C5FB7D3|nr:protein-L-isoaspartate(D-aspartate) O-methyltransferase [Nonomuraea ceibae]